MSRMKRSSKSLEQAKTRAAALASIDPQLDLGNSLTLALFQSKITGTETTLNSYNGKLSEVDAALNNVVLSEKELEDMSARMLAAVAVKFGRDSNEYEMSGGTRLSERKAPKRNGNGKAKPS